MCARAYHIDVVAAAVVAYEVVVEASGLLERRGVRALLVVVEKILKHSVHARDGAVESLQIGSRRRSIIAFRSAARHAVGEAASVHEQQVVGLLLRRRASARAVDDLHLPVMCYGLRTDFRTRSFPGSARLLELAHSLEELKTICRCGRKAVFNTRKVVDPATGAEHFVFEGDQVAIDGVQVTYESLCGTCYLAESGGALG